MKLKIIKGEIKKNIKVPTSKSWANRYLIIAAIQKGPTTINNISSSTDVDNLLAAFEKIGLVISRKKDTVVVHNSFPECEKLTDGNKIILNTGDGGTTNRFLLALLSLGEKKYQLVTSKEFRSRPNDDLFQVLEKNGVSLLKGHPDFWVEICGNGGMTENRTIEIDCSKSTQFYSALILAYANSNLKFISKNVESSQSYILMSENLLEQYQKNIHEFNTPVDFSSLSYPVAFVCDGEFLNVTNCLEIDKFQADSFLLTFLENKGIQFHFSKEGLKVISEKFDYKPFDLECSGFPDLVPTLVFIACLCQGRSTLRGLGVLKHKESDRYIEICKILKAFQIIFETNERNDELTIIGPCNEINIKSISLPPDHRIIMLASMLLKKFGQGEVDQVEHVKKSYPDFFVDFNI